jgi:hypothetical protein
MGTGAARSAAEGDPIMARAPKLSDYVEIAAAEYLREIGNVELDSRWIAEFVQDSGVLDAYPRQDLVEFFALVEKALAKHADRAGKEARLHLDRIARIERGLRRP